MWRAPALDFVVSAGVTYNAHTGTRVDRRTSVYAAGEIAHLSYDAQLSTTEKGIPSALRLRAFRSDPDGGLLGPLKATHFAVGEKDRNYNLKVAAEKLNGHILMPGEEMSFNAIVGDRTEKEGYRVAHVIQAGEMIDGLAGGTCQISSTLHAAAFFAGLEMTSTRPHSRPSAYITMGLDATVVYPTTDFKMKNPSDFPVAIRYEVAQGIVRVEILGKERPWEKVQFEREILEEKPFETITREDPTLPIGATVVEQAGFPGYKLERRRVFFKDGKKVKTEKRKLEYPPTTEYLRIGTNPDPNLVAPEQPKIHGPMDPGGKEFKMAQ